MVLRGRGAGLTSQVRDAAKPREEVLTWQVMVELRGAAYLWIMQATTLPTSSTLSSSTPAPSSTSSSSAAARAPGALPAALVLAAFTAFSLWVVYVDGPLGFLSLARREPWGMQLLLDLCISAFIALSWIIRDARQRKIAAWPYVAATMLVGSIGLLSYLVRRGFAAPAAPVAPVAAQR